MIIDANGKRPFEIRDSTGKEFKKIYDADGNLLFKNWNTIQGAPPIVFKGYNKALKNYKIYGNTIQDGTPTPETPVEVQGVGEYDAELDGYKIPVTVSNGINSVTTPVYAGSEPLHKIDGYVDYIDFERGVVVRKIKKLVLTGKETITKAASNPVFTMQLSGSNTPFSENVVTTLSTHYQAQNNVAGTGNVNDMSVCVRRGYSTMYIGDTRYDNTTDFKTYLAAQYAAGTPVNVWYVLAEPEETPLSDLNPITPLKGVNTLSTNTTIQPSEIYLKGKIKSLATHTG